MDNNGLLFPAGFVKAVDGRFSPLLTKRESIARYYLGDVAYAKSLKATMVSALTVVRKRISDRCLLRRGRLNESWSVNLSNRTLLLLALANFNASMSLLRTSEERRDRSLRACDMEYALAATNIAAEFDLKESDVHALIISAMLDAQTQALVDESLVLLKEIEEKLGMSDDIDVSRTTT